MADIETRRSLLALDEVAQIDGRRGEVDGCCVADAPSDADLRNIDWQELFTHFTPVVSVDLARIISGLNDLSHAPYLVALSLTDWVLAFGNGGMFAERQTELLSAVPEKVKEFAEAGGLRLPELFIYENYRIF